MEWQLCIQRRWQLVVRRLLKVLDFEHAPNMKATRGISQLFLSPTGSQKVHAQGLREGRHDSKALRWHSHRDCATITMAPNGEIQMNPLSHLTHFNSVPLRVIVIPRQRHSRTKDDGSSSIHKHFLVSLLSSPLHSD